MRHSGKVHLALLAGLVACAQVPTNKHEFVAAKKTEITRSIAAANDFIAQENVDQKVTKITDGLYYSYLLGQSHLEEFDRLLDKDPAAAMKSDSYSALLAIRSNVDNFEHDLNELQYGLTLFVHENDSISDKRTKAAQALSKIENFVKGIRTDSSTIHENLQPLILTNLRQNLAEVYDKIFDSIEVNQNDYMPDAKDTLSKKLDVLKISYATSGSNLHQYKVNPQLVKETLKNERKNNAFKEFEADIKRQSKLMKEFISETGRDTSGAGLAPSTGPNGNISGSKYPNNTWSLTFDDGPGKTTEQLVTNLVQKKIPATFFMLAQQAVALPKTVNRIKAEGFDIACHSYTHAQLTKVGPAQLEKEIGGAKKTIENVTGKPIKLFRLPYGAGVSVSHVRAKIAEQNMIHVFWTVDTLDWQDKNPTSILNRALKQMNASSKNAGIILFHDIHTQSVAASTMLMDYFNSKKMNVCTVQGVVDQMNNELSTCK